MMIPNFKFLVLCLGLAICDICYSQSANDSINIASVDSLMHEELLEEFPVQTETIYYPDTVQFIGSKGIVLNSDSIMLGPNTEAEINRILNRNDAITVFDPPGRFHAYSYEQGSYSDGRDFAVLNYKHMSFRIVYSYDYSKKAKVQELTEIRICRMESSELVVKGTIPGVSEWPLDQDVRIKKGSVRLAPSGY